MSDLRNVIMHYKPKKPTLDQIARSMELYGGSRGNPRDNSGAHLNAHSGANRGSAGASDTSKVNKGSTQLPSTEEMIAFVLKGFREHRDANEDPSAGVDYNERFRGGREHYTV